MKKLNIKDLILYENEEVLAINKPSGISTLEDRVDTTNVLSLAKEWYPQIKNCHRLDKYTSGVLLFAKNPGSYRSISLQFQNREIKKIYHAIVHGASDFKNFEVKVPLVVRGSGIVLFDYKEGKESNTFFTTIKNFKTCSLVECQPVTGRKHQIRVHLKYAKHSIISDKDYDGEYIFLSQIKRNYKKNQREERPIISRMALHAHSISFKLSNGEPVTMEAPYPKDFRLALSQLEKYG